MSLADVYNFKSAIEPAIGAALEANALTALTPQDPQAFQKDRARVEVMFVLGAGKQGHLAMSEVTGLPCDVEDAWSATVQLAIISEASADKHGKYEAAVRYVMAQLPSLVNDMPGGLINHVIYGPVTHLGSTPTLKPEDGIYRTEMQFGFTFSIHQQAWADLTP